MQNEELLHGTQGIGRHFDIHLGRSQFLQYQRTAADPGGDRLAVECQSDIRPIEIDIQIIGVVDLQSHQKAGFERVQILDIEPSQGNPGFLKVAVVSSEQ